MKKIISFLLVLSVVMTMSVCAFATSSVTVDSAPVVSTNTAPAAAAEEEKVLTAEDVAVVPAEELEGEAAEAYTALSEAESIADVCANIADVLAVVNADLAVEDLVVRDVFAVDFEAAAEGEYVAVAFDYAIEAGETLIVLQYVDGEWVAVDPELVEIVDGQVIVKLQQAGTLAFVTEAV